MDFRLYTLYNAGDANGTVVVIDVLRACTTMCYLFNSGVKTIFPVAEIADAFALKKRMPDALLVGERKGLPVEGFDYCNSPSQIQNTDLSGKTVIMTTTAGTKGIIAACTHADEVITGSFVNAGAIATYITWKQPQTVSFVSTDSCTFDHEDYICASYIRSLLENEPRDFSVMKRYIADAPHSDGFLRTPLTPYAPEDFSLCLRTDVFPFVIQAEKINGMIQLHRMEGT